jgi:hypothetical protein
MAEKISKSTSDTVMAPALYLGIWKSKHKHGQSYWFHYWRIYYSLGFSHYLHYGLKNTQRNIKNIDEFTHRKKVRCVKQGFEYYIANHLEYLTCKWPRADQQSSHTKRLYKRGEEMCIMWVAQRDMDTDHEAACDQISNNIDLEVEEESSLGSSSSDEQSITTEYHTSEKNRFHFDRSMFDTLEHIIILKVDSHQLNKEFSIKIPQECPSPNLFLVSASQYADNAVSQAKKVMPMMQEKL